MTDNDFSILANRTIKEIKRSLRMLDQVDLRKCSYEKYFDLCKIAYDGIKVNIFQLGGSANKNNDSGHGIFRARECKINYPYEDVKDLWAKPAEAVVEAGRCNAVNESILYCSTYLPTALIECKVQNNTYWTISEFEIISGELLHIKELGIRKHKFREQAANTLEFPDMYEGVEKSLIKKNTLIDDHIHKCFVHERSKNNVQYKKTVAITHYFLKAPAAEQRIDGLLYPSIAAKLHGYNIAIRTNVAKEKIRLKNVQFVKVTILDKTKDQIVIVPLAVGEIFDQKVIWTQA